MNLNSDLVRLLLIAAVVLAVMYVRNNYLQDGVKNDGTLSVGVESEESEGGAEHDVTDGVNVEQPKHVAHGQLDDVNQDELYKNNTNVLPRPQMSNTNAPQGNFRPAQLSNFAQMDCFPKDQLSAKDLIPREDAYNVWNQSNPPVQGALSNKNFLDSGHHYGLNTVGQSLKNANLQLRSDPLIPQRQVGPWLQSTIEADTNRRPFEIGGC